MTNPIKPLMLAESWRGLSSTGKRMWKQMHDGGGIGTNADAFNKIMRLIYLCPGTEVPHSHVHQLKQFSAHTRKTSDETRAITAINAGEVVV